MSNVYNIYYDFISAGILGGSFLVSFTTSCLEVNGYKDILHLIYEVFSSKMKLNEYNYSSLEIKEIKPSNDNILRADNPHSNISSNSEPELIPITKEELLKQINETTQEYVDASKKGGDVLKKIHEGASGDNFNMDTVQHQAGIIYYLQTQSKLLTASYSNRTT